MNSSENFSQGLGGYDEANYFQNYERPTITLKKLTLIESRSYRPQWVRPYEMEVGYYDLENIKHTVERSVKTRSINNLELELQKNSPNILTPSSRVTGEAKIANGWGEKRFKFIMVLEMTYPSTNVTLINYVQGYSEFLGMTHSGIIDPNMKLFINSVSVLRKTFDSQTGKFTIIPLHKYNVVQNDLSNLDYVEGNFMPDVRNFNDTLKLSRPEDILANMTTLRTVESGTTVISDVGNVNQLNIVESKHLIPTQHVSSTVSTAVDTVLAGSVYDDNADLLSAMLGFSLTIGPEQILVFKLILDATGMLRSYFTLNELTRMLGVADVNYDVILSKEIGSMHINNNVPTILQTESTEDTYGAEIETRKSILIHEAIVNTLNNSLLSQIVFEIDNLSIEPNYAILSAASEIEGLDLVYHANKFISMFITKAWTSITENNAIPIKLLVSANIISDTTISISIGSNPEVVYRYPTFADSKYLPLIVDNSGLTQLTEAYEAVVDTALNTSRAVSHNLSTL